MKTLNELQNTFFESYVRDLLFHFKDNKVFSLDTEVVYIAGKVTGLNYPDVVAKFNKRKAELIAAGYLVISPIDFIDATADWKKAMAICLILLPLCKHISLLHDWQDSEGATIEKYLADKLAITSLTLANQ